MATKNVLITSLTLIMLIVFGASFLNAWETPMIIAGEAGHNYEKPEVGFGPSGAVYISYRDKDNNVGGNSDIWVARWDGKELIKENVSELASKWGRHKAYEGDIEVDSEERIHVAWIGHDRNTPDLHHIMYRYKDGNTWSPVYDLGELHMHGGDVAFDTRLGVDSNMNVHVITYKEHDTSIWYVAKYGDTILPVEKLGNPGSRLKHADIAVDDNYVHAIWMRKIGYPYVIVHQKWENKIGATKSEITQITFPKGTYASQKSRIDLDSAGALHLAEFHKTGIVKKLKYYKQNPDDSWTPYVNLSDPNKLQLYHWAGLEVRDNSMIATMQLGSTSGGSGVYYNWNKNGQWQGYQKIPSTNGCVHTSVDLSMDGLVAGVTYGKTTSNIMFVSSEPITASGLLEAQYTYPGTVFWGSEVAFDASQCTGLNPEHNIALYHWDFGDGNIETTTTPTTSHSFNTYNTDITVKLEIEAATGETGKIENTFHVHALYSAIVTSTESKRVRTLFFNRPAYAISWQDNPKNSEAGYPSIVKYEIYRAPVSSSLSEGDYTRVNETTGTAFLDYFGVQDNTNYVYAIRCIDSEGHISPLGNQ